MNKRELDIEDYFIEKVDDYDGTQRIYIGHKEEKDEPMYFPSPRNEDLPMCSHEKIVIALAIVASISIVFMYTTMIILLS